MPPRRDSFTLLRERTRWSLALQLCGFGMVMILLLGVLNARIGRPESVTLAIGVLSCLTVVLLLLIFLPKHLGSKVYFWFNVALLLYTPIFGWQHTRDLHFWAYILPPVLFFVLRPTWALAGSLLYGGYVCLMMRTVLPAIDIARIGVSYVLLVAFVYTYARLEESAAAMLRYHSDHDPLTNCFNRRTFNETISLLEATRGGETCAFLLLDVDHFKQINDAHGHLVGDRAITGVAAALGRAVDPATPVYRYGGEEFAVIVPGCAEADAMTLADRLRREVESQPIGEVRVTASVGVAIWEPARESAAAALDRADAALYAAKRGGRNRVVSAEQPAGAPADRRRPQREPAASGAGVGERPALRAVASRTDPP